jgi:hypothetical protein
MTRFRSKKSRKERLAKRAIPSIPPAIIFEPILIGYIIATLIPIILFMLTEPKLIKSKMAVFLKKMNQDQTGTPQKEKEDPKIIVKAGKMINYSKNSNSYFTDVELNSDNMHNLKRELQKN